MKILVIDKDPLPAQFISSRLEPLGHQIFSEPSKKQAVKRCQSDEFDLIILDPSPLTSPRALILDIRRNSPYAPYSIMLSETPASKEDILKFGVNDALAKPINQELLDQKIENAKYFIELSKRISDDSEDFPSAGGIIGKSAFNQLFLSAIDRADRYGESTFLLLVSLSNYSEIYSTQGPYAADYAVAKLSQHLITLRRQTDIIGQTAPNEYALLLQRPVYETEPMDAANRFTENLANYDGFASLDAKDIELSITLVSIPNGEQPVKNIFRPLENSAT